MANTITLTSTKRGEFRQATSWFKETWALTGSVVDSDAVALTAIGEFDITVAGVALGDMVIGVAYGADFDDGTDQAQPTAHVSAAGVVTVQWAADNAEFAADALNGASFKMLIGRPAW
jgi:hypothetical protein